MLLLSLAIGCSVAAPEPVWAPSAARTPPPVTPDPEATPAPAYAATGALADLAPTTTFWPTDLEMSVRSVPETATYTYGGARASSYLGGTVSVDGDLDGDGLDDLITGAYNAGASTEGEVYIYFGDAAGLPATADTTLTGPATSSQFGDAAASGGDVNGDGYDDLLAGAPNTTLASGQRDGKVFVHHGSATGVASAADAELEGEVTTDDYGDLVGGAGDINGDGFADVYVGAPHEDTTDGNEGRVYVYLGAAGGVDASTVVLITGTTPSAQLGSSLAAVGDVDADGYDDLLVGHSLDDVASTNSGSAYLFHGGPSGLETTARTTLRGANSSDGFGVVGAAGDVDGDGYADVVIGAYGYDDGAHTSAGAAYVFHGSAAGLTTTATTIVVGQNTSDSLGEGVGGAGDLDGDGFGDILVGAPNNDTTGTNAGVLYVHLGSAAGVLASASVTLAPAIEQDGFGDITAGGGDLDGDGYDDIAVGSPLNDDYGTNSGQVYVYFGYRDDDRDGVSADVDCDDTDASVGAGSPGYADADDDGFGDPDTESVVCADTGSFVADGSDCDDTRADVSPAAVEVCDPDDVDEDCDGAADDADESVDPATLLALYRDADGDGHGAAGEARIACAADGWSLLGDDCDDTTAARSPSAPEVCDPLPTDEDCDGLADDDDDSVDDATRMTWYADADHDDYGDPADSVRACRAPRGHIADATDCDPLRTLVNPGGQEVCDALDLDEDCDGASDDADPSVDPATEISGHLDADGDGYGDPTAIAEGCEATADAGDCDDSDAARATDCATDDAPSCGCAAGGPAGAGSVLLLAVAGLLLRRRR
ncbi:MAG: integrin alpha [Pseudomonadota bacterium]|nr:integrin alpha [Pseudomonadota bacterium]